MVFVSSSQSIPLRSINLHICNERMTSFGLILRTSIAIFELILRN
ncbi:unnamed protein product [Musa acuminata subsp. malaccensis]|uniref:(wild Malaysian banana) hypothetical protein n=1 Tax=Musa acuminata subsp. malaccensis TaxID=214687 RepID=A0A804IB85_MUSAM|nr:unnamed protein product [Musa acuminata subsp. malaccensis]